MTTPPRAPPRGRADEIATSVNNKRGDIPRARWVRCFACVNPCCRRPHVVLLDADEEPIAEFICDDPETFICDFQDAAEAALED